MSAPAFGESRIHSRDLFGNRFHTLDTPLRLRAFAKINLGLSILGRRPDHYHEIQTVVQTVRLHDRLEVSLKKRDRSIEVLCDAPDIRRVPGIWFTGLLNCGDASEVLGLESKSG